MAWIEYHTALRDHWKIKRLADILEVEYITALGAISCLWLWVADYAQDGNITRFNDDEIRYAAHYNCKKFCLEALKKCELVNEKGYINDWSKHGLKLLKSNRKRQKEFQKKKRYNNVIITPTIPNQPNQPNQPYILAQSQALLKSFPKNLTPLITEYIALSKKENKTNTITLNKEMRLLNELYQFFIVCDPGQFMEALKITVNNEAPNINYLKKVYKGHEKRVKVFQKLEAQKQKEEWDKGVLFGKKRTEETKDLIKKYEITKNT